MFLQATKSLVRLKLNATSSRHNSSPLSHIRVSLLYISVYRLSNTNLYHFELDVPTWLHNVMICQSVDPCFPDTRSHFIMARKCGSMDQRITDYNAKVDWNCTPAFNCCPTHLFVTWRIEPGATDMSPIASFIL